MDARLDTTAVPAINSPVLAILASDASAPATPTIDTSVPAILGTWDWESDSISCVVEHPNKTHYITGHYNRFIKICDLDEYIPDITIRSPIAQASFIISLAITPENNLVVGNGVKYVDYRGVLCEGDTPPTIQYADIMTDINRPKKITDPIPVSCEPSFMACVKDGVFYGAMDNYLHFYNRINKTNRPLMKLQEGADRIIGCRTTPLPDELIVLTLYRILLINTREEKTIRHSVYSGTAFPSSITHLHSDIYIIGDSDGAISAWTINATSIQPTFFANQHLFNGGTTLLASSAEKPRAFLGLARSTGNRIFGVREDMVNTLFEFAIPPSLLKKSESPLSLGSASDKAQPQSELKALPAPSAPIPQQELKEEEEKEPIPEDPAYIVFLEKRSHITCAVTFGEHSEYIATGFRDRNFTIRAFNKDQPISSWEYPTHSWVSSLAVSPNGLLVTGISGPLNYLQRWKHVGNGKLMPHDSPIILEWAPTILASLSDTCYAYATGSEQKLYIVNDNSPPDFVPFKDVGNVSALCRQRASVPGEKDDLCVAIGNNIWHVDPQAAKIKDVIAFEEKDVANICALTQLPSGNIAVGDDRGVITVLDQETLLLTESARIADSAPIKTLSSTYNGLLLFATNTHLGLKLTQQSITLQKPQAMEAQQTESKAESITATPPSYSQAIKDEPPGYTDSANHFLLTPRAFRRSPADGTRSKTKAAIEVKSARP